jgi:medium-chain acyl-[acyl-carrier-protein] hydrolase
MATLRLLCIPFAGAGASAFRGWAALLPPDVEAFAVQLPAREDRLREPCIDAWQPMMAALIGAVAPLPPMPTAIFGHSLGAVVALQLGRWMQASQGARLRHVFASGRAWPGAGAAERADLHTLADDDLLQALDAQYGSLSTSLSHPEIRALALPALRADLRLLASYRHAASTPLDCALTVFAGRDDPMTSGADLTAWRQETRGPFAIREFDGGHFFPESDRRELLAAIVAALEGTSGSG